MSLSTIKNLITATLSLHRNEPVLLSSLVTAALGYLVSSGAITATQASSLTQVLVTALPVVLGGLVRQYVSPVLRKLPTELTGEEHVAEFLAELGLDPHGDPLPQVAPDPAPTSA